MGAIPPIRPIRSELLDFQKAMYYEIVSQFGIPAHMMEEQTPQQLSRYQDVLLLGRIKEEITTGPNLTGQIRGITVYGRGNNITYHVQVGHETIPIPWRGVKAVNIPKGYEVGAKVWVKKGRRGEVLSHITSHTWSKECDEPLHYGVEIDGQPAGFFKKEDMKLQPTPKKSRNTGPRKVVIDES